MQGKILKSVSLVSYLIELIDGRQVKLHQDHLSHRSMVSEESDTYFSSVFGDVAWEVSISAAPEPTNIEFLPIVDNPPLSHSNSSDQSCSQRYSERLSKPPVRF